MWSPAAVSLWKELSISIFYLLDLSGCSKQSPKLLCLAPEKNLLIPDPLHIPHIICSYLFCTCLLSQTILTIAMGGLHSFPFLMQKASVFAETPWPSCSAVSPPPDEAKVCSQALSTFGKPKGTHSNIGAVCIYTVVTRASLGFCLMLSSSFSPSFLSNGGCVLGNTEPLYMFL